MRCILSKAHGEVLRRFICSNALLAFDYDGTLAPIVADPERAAMGQTTRELLSELAKRYLRIVLSGRSQRDALLRALLTLGQEAGIARPPRGAQ